MMSSTKRRVLKSFRANLDSEVLGVHFLIRAFMVLLIARMKKSPDSGAPWRQPRSREITWSGFVPHKSGMILLWRSSLAKAKIESGMGGGYSEGLQESLTETLCQRPSGGPI